MDSTSAQRRVAPVDLFIARHTTLPTSVRLDDAEKPKAGEQYCYLGVGFAETIAGTTITDY
jgi:hypothetical protein